MAGLYERARLVARGEAGRGLPHRSALSEGGDGMVRGENPRRAGARPPETPPLSESAEIPESCSFCGEPVKVVSYFRSDDERLAPFGARGEDTWARLTCKCGDVELLVRAKELA